MHGQQATMLPAPTETEYRSMLALAHTESRILLDDSAEFAFGPFSNFVVNKIETG